MQFKPVPEPPATLDALAAVRAALPREADPDLDCCARVIERTAVDSRDAAADWITFCRALGLAAAESDGYRREPLADGLDADRLGRAFRAHVVGVDHVLGALDDIDGPAAPEAVFERLDAGDGIPESERRRHGDRLRNAWTDRVERLLEWAVLFGLVERVDGGYRPARWPGFGVGGSTGAPDRDPPDV